MGYRWYHLPGRAVLLARALGRSLWHDWFPPLLIVSPRTVGRAFPPLR